MNKAGLLIIALAVAASPMAARAQAAPGSAPLTGPRKITVRAGRPDGDEERSDLRSLAEHYSLKILFSPAAAAYTARVKIVDGKGRVQLDYEPAGPWFWADLPQGDYTVAVNWHDRQETRRITIGDDPKVLTFFRDGPPAS